MKAASGRKSLIHTYSSLRVGPDKLGASRVIPISTSRAAVAVRFLTRDVVNVRLDTTRTMDSPNCRAAREFRRVGGAFEGG